MPVKMKIFTVSEANRLIPVLESLLRDFQSKVLKMEKNSLQWELHHRRESPRTSQTRKNPPSSAGFGELQRLEQELGDILKLINQVGCVVRDPRQGLIDFPGVLGKEPVYLCWKLGEEKVEFYHGVEDGYQGRKLLPQQDVA